MKKHLWIAGLLATCAAVPAAAEDATDLAARFGALEAVGNIGLSPDGTKVAYISPKPGGGQILSVADLSSAQPPKPIAAKTSADESMRSCQFVTDARLICRVSGQFRYDGEYLSASRQFALDIDGSHVVMLTKIGGDGTTTVALGGGGVIDWNVPGKPGHVLYARTFVPREGSATYGGSIIEKRDEGLGVEDLDVVSMKRSTIERANRDAGEYISDGQGNVRIIGTYGTNSAGRDTGKIHYRFRKPGSREWSDLAKVTYSAQTVDTGFVPVAVDPAKNLAYGFDQHDGRKALYSLTLDDGLQRTLVLARPDVDVDSLVQIGRNSRVVGVSYATERRVVEYFDPELNRLFGALQKALPGHPAVSAVDASADESKLLLFASSDVDPGAFYLFDKKTRQLGEVLPVRPQLKGVAMGEMRSISFKAADGTVIPGYLTLPPGSTGKGLPSIVMPHGGPTGRDEWGFDWLVQFFAARGYAVLQPNFRGSSGYGSDYFKDNGFKSWRTAIGDVNDAGHWLVSQGIAAPSKLVIFGWSYGGYAALQTAVVDPSLFKAIVAVAPVTDLAAYKEEARLFGGYNLRKDFVGDGPHLVEGSPARNAARITAPVLMFHGDRDQNVKVDESKLMVAKLTEAGKSVDFVEFPDLDHYLLDSAARTRLLSQSDAFFRKAIGN